MFLPSLKRYEICTPTPLSEHLIILALLKMKGKYQRIFNLTRIPCYYLETSMNNISVYWNTLFLNQWHNINDIPLILSSGVYVIFNESEVLYIGKSNNISGRLTHHKENLLTGENPPIYFTWADVTDTHIDGVERFLVEHYNPKYNLRIPNVQAVKVNLPF